MIRVKYNTTTGKVEGYFPEKVNYKNINIDVTKKTIDDSPYITICEEDHISSMGKDMYIVNGAFCEKVESEDSLLSNSLSSKKDEIKSEAYKLIKQSYPDYKQRNILMSGDILKISDMNAAITKIRNRSNELEAGLKDLTLSEITNFNIIF